MKKSLLIALLTLIVVGPALAQEEPIPPRRSRAMKVGLFAGYTPGYLFVDTAPINKYLQGAGGEPFAEDGLYLHGGGGAIYIMVLPNVRVGGMGMSGSTMTSKSVNGVRKESELSVGFGGLTFEHVWTLGGKFDVALGSMVGWGSTTVTLRQNIGTDKSWETEWGTFGSGNYQNGAQIVDVRREMRGSFFTVVPAVNLEYAPLSWLAIRLGASYVGMFFPSWSLDTEYDLKGVPSDVNGSGFMINGGILLGTF